MRELGPGFRVRWVAGVPVLQAEVLEVDGVRHAFSTRRYPQADDADILRALGFRPEAVVEALAAGVTDFGENRVQETLGKQATVAEMAAVRVLSAPTWHLVGHLQTNKARAAAGAFAILHGVDSVRLLDVLDRWAPGRPVRVLLEVNVAEEATKFGLAPSELPAVVARARGLVGVELMGLMTVAPRVADPEEVRPVFRRLADLAREYGLRELSMG
ncbi:MAG: hypothetical protein C4303_05965, partial [candidate division GAL15 bacterium]